MSIEQTKQRRQAVDAVHDIVSAMRAIAAGRIQGAQRALANARRYQQVIERALALLPPDARSSRLPPSKGQTMLLVLTSEQPFCGTFNDQVLTLAERRWHEIRKASRVWLVAIGQKGQALMAGRGLLPDENVRATTSLQGLRTLVSTMARLVDERYGGRGLSEVRIIYNRYHSVSEQVPTEEKLLPFDWSRFKTEGRSEGREIYRYLPVPELVAGLVSEYVFINLYRIAAESFASEQASRLVAMDGATRNSEKMLERLGTLERRQRQEQITRQVLELIAARFVGEEADTRGHAT